MPGRHSGRGSGRQQEQISRRNGDDDLATVVGDLPSTPSSPNDGTTNTQSSNDDSTTPLLAQRSNKGTGRPHHDSSDDRKPAASQNHPNVTSPRRTDHHSTTSQNYQCTLLTPNTEGINSDVVRAVEDTEQKLDEATRSMGIKDADGGDTYAPNFVRKLFPNRSSSKDTLPDERSKKDKKKGGKPSPEN